MRSAFIPSSIDANRNQAALAPNGGLYFVDDFSADNNLMVASPKDH